MSPFKTRVLKSSKSCYFLTSYKHSYKWPPTFIYLPLYVQIYTTKIWAQNYRQDWSLLTGHDALLLQLIARNLIHASSHRLDDTWTAFDEPVVGTGGNKSTAHWYSSTFWKQADRTGLEPEQRVRHTGTLTTVLFPRPLPIRGSLQESKKLQTLLISLPVKVPSQCPHPPKYSLKNYTQMASAQLLLQCHCQYSLDCSLPMQCSFSIFYLMPWEKLLSSMSSSV